MRMILRNTAIEKIAPVRMLMFFRAAGIAVTICAVRMQYVPITAVRMAMHRFRTLTARRTVRVFRLFTIRRYRIFVGYAVAFTVFIPSPFDINKAVVVISLIDIPVRSRTRRARRRTALRRTYVVPTSGGVRVLFRAAASGGMRVFFLAANKTFRRMRRVYGRIAI